MIYLILNEVIAFLVLITVFPGAVRFEDLTGVFATCALLLCMSFIWWLYLLVAPIAFLFMDVDKNYWLDNWPWTYLKSKKLWQPRRRRGR